MKTSLPKEFKEYIEKMVLHPSKAIRNPSAFTSIFYIMGYKGTRFMKVKAMIEKEIGRVLSAKG